MAEHRDGSRPLYAPSPADAPIGVFDSGVGGLSVLREIRALLPSEHLTYVADSGHAPYGDKPAGAICARAFAVTEFLLDQGAKAIVVACNTATAAAAQALRERFAVPIIAMEPAVKPAVALSRSGVVGVLATSQTLASHNFVQLLGRFGAGANVLVQPCPGLVEQVERGALDDADTLALLADLVQPLLDQGADTLVLGCTHYPHLTPLLGGLVGPGVRIMDSGAAVARQVQRRLAALDLLRTPDTPGQVGFWSSAQPLDAAAGVMTRLWTAAGSGPAPVLALPELPG